jgi:phage baseplate assembly protein gpV
MMGPGVVTGWIPLIARGAGKDRGFWQLPDIGTQVVMAFVGNSYNVPVVLGCLYDLKHLPPKHSSRRAADSAVYQTKNHRVEIVDEEGKESITICTAKGKMRLTLASGKGIEIINELGDIKIKCRKMKIAGGSLSIKAEKKVRIKSGGDIKMHARKDIKIKCGKEIKIKGKNIRLNGRRGVTTEGKQLAAEGDKVMGFDIHQMEIPAGLSTAVVPLPHPYIGKVVDKVSDNVKVKGHNAAVKGSVSRHDSPVHMQLPGTIRFVVNPNKEGEVTGNTGKKVKINGKEAAVIGSTVTTCNDVGMRENSTIIAAGAGIPMPVIINPKNMKEWEEEREKGEKLHPEITEAKWGKGRVKEGEKAEMVARVKDIGDGDMVTFQVWKEGQDPAAHIAQGQIPGSIEGGVAKGEWAYRVTDIGEFGIPEEEPKFYFTAHSAWCPYKESGNLVVELKRPGLSGPEWQDADGKGTGKGLAGEALKLSVSCNEDMEEGGGVIFRVYGEGADPERDRPVEEIGSENKGGKAEAEWTYRYKHDPENPLKEKPKYFFTANGVRCKEVKSGNVEISQNLRTRMITSLDKPAIGKPYEIYLPDESVVKGETDNGGIIRADDLIPGIYQVMIKGEEDNSTHE